MVGTYAVRVASRHASPNTRAESGLERILHLSA